MRVLVCRARADGLRTARALAAHGHEAVIAPVLAIRPLPFALPPGPFDAVAATSGHAVECLPPDPIPLLRLHRAFAVGARTADALRGAGWADVRAAEGRATALLGLINAVLPGPARLLYLTGRIRTPGFEHDLRQAGHTVEAVETYDACRADPWEDTVAALVREGRIGACLHYSARSARLSLAFARQAKCLDAFARVRHICLSAPVAAALGASTASLPVVAAAPTGEGLAQALSRSVGD